MAPLAFVTMVRGDYQMLHKWVTHYGKLVDNPRSLYVVAHGDDPEVSRIAALCSVIVVPYDSRGDGFETHRRSLFWGLVRALKGYHDFVVTLDIDEFLVLDPNIDKPLHVYLRDHRFKGVAVSPLGIDVIHKPSVEHQEAPLSEPVIGPRRYGMLQGQYSKPCIFRESHTGGGTQHELRGQPWDIDTNLILFHLRFYDREYAEAQSNARLDQFKQFQEHGDNHDVGGWNKRIEMMNRIMALVEDKPATLLNLEVSRRFVVEQQQAYEARGRKLNWRKSLGSIITIPDRFCGLA